MAKFWSVRGDILPKGIPYLNALPIISPYLNALPIISKYRTVLPMNSVINIYSPPPKKLIPASDSCFHSCYQLISKLKLESMDGVANL